MAQTKTCLLLTGTLLIAGCSGAPVQGGGEPATTTLSPTATPPTATAAADDGSATARLGTDLRELVAAENRTQAAGSAGITVTDGRIRVLVTLRNDTATPAVASLTVESRDGTRLQATVALADLTTLAGDPAVRSVRRPLQGQTDAATNSIDT